MLLYHFVHFSNGFVIGFVICKHAHCDVIGLCTSYVANKWMNGWIMLVYFDGWSWCSVHPGRLWNVWVSRLPIPAVLNATIIKSSVSVASFTPQSLIGLHSRRFLLIRSYLPGGVNTCIHTVPLTTPVCSLHYRSARKGDSHENGNASMPKMGMGWLFFKCASVDSMQMQSNQIM